jgi:hypothetical protein
MLIEAVETKAVRPPVTVRSASASMRYRALGCDIVGHVSLPSTLLCGADNGGQDPAGQSATSDRQGALCAIVKSIVGMPEIEQIYGLW